MSQKEKSSKELQTKTSVTNPTTISSAAAAQRISKNNSIASKAGLASNVAATAAVTTTVLAPVLATAVPVNAGTLTGTAATLAAGRTTSAAVAALRVSGTVLKRFGLPGLAVGVGLDLVAKYYGNKAAAEQANVDAQAKDAKRAQNFPPPNFDYNLPPHEWSLPIRASEVDVFTKVGEKSPNVDKYTVIDPLFPTEIAHRYRRGVIWHWDDGSYVSAEKDGEIKTAGEIQAEIAKSAKSGSKKAEAEKGTGKLNNYNFGFQFLWNPETISQSIARNMDVTPSSADRFRSVAGAFPGQETFQFSIVLDRVNDFACLRSLVGKGKSPDVANYKGTTDVSTNVFNAINNTVRFPDSAIPGGFLKYYKYGLGAVNEKKLRDLARFGTMADLEYLFKCLNGTGENSAAQGWTTLLNKPTSNIGFLSPTLIACRLGPDATSSLSFVGWITNLSINHTYFTEDMIPLRTAVTFSCDAFAGSTIV